MPKPKKRKTDLTLEQFIKGYEYKSLHAAINGLHDSFAWELLTAYLRYKQREFEVAALDLMCHDGHQNEAIKASGYAAALEDVISRTLPDLTNIVLGNTGIVEQPRPEEN